MFVDDGRVKLLALVKKDLDCGSAHRAAEVAHHVEETRGGACLMRRNPEHRDRGDRDSRPQHEPVLHVRALRPVRASRLLIGVSRLIRKRCVGGSPLSPAVEPGRHVGALGVAPGGRNGTERRRPAYRRPRSSKHICQHRASLGDTPEVVARTMSRNVLYISAVSICPFSIAKPRQASPLKWSKTMLGNFSESHANIHRRTCSI